MIKKAAFGSLNQIDKARSISNQRAVLSQNVSNPVDRGVLVSKRNKHGRMFQEE